MADHKPASRSRVRRVAQRASYDRDTIHAIIDAVAVCHVAVAVGGQPRLIPMYHARVDATLYLHGSPASQLLQAIAAGAETCVGFTHLDGLIFARSALHHSMNYRSVVLFGRGRAVADDHEKMAALRALTERAAPGRWLETRQPSDAEFKATAVTALPIDDVSAKVRTGPPVDDPGDLELPWWAGEVPFRTVAGPAIPAPDLTPGIAVPRSVLSLIGGDGPGGRVPISS